MEKREIDAMLEKVKEILERDDEYADALRRLIQSLYKGLTSRRSFGE